MQEHDENEYTGFDPAEEPADPNPYRCVFDTETTGFASPKLSATDPKQNVVVELGCSLINVNTFKVEQSFSVIICTPEPFINSFVVDVHGITNEFSIAVGCDLELALANFVHMAKVSNWQFVGHNIDFDERMMLIMLERSSAFRQYINDFNQGDFYCTMERSKNIVKCPPTDKMVKAGFGNQFKPPKLEEAYRFFYPERPMFDAHRVSGDVQATVDVFKKIYEEY